MKKKYFKGETFRVKDGLVYSVRVDGKWKNEPHPMKDFRGTSTCASLARYIKKDSDSIDTATGRVGTHAEWQGLLASTGFTTYSEIN